MKIAERIRLLKTKRELLKKEEYLKDLYGLSYDGVDDDVVISFAVDIDKMPDLAEVLKKIDQINSQLKCR